MRKFNGLRPQDTVLFLKPVVGANGRHWLGKDRVQELALERVVVVRGATVNPCSTSGPRTPQPHVTHDVDCLVAVAPHTASRIGSSTARTRVFKRRGSWCNLPLALQIAEVDVMPTAPTILTRQPETR